MDSVRGDTSPSSEYSFSDLLTRFNLFYHLAAYAFIPVIALLPFSIYFLYPLMILMFIGPVLPLTLPLTMIVYAVLGEQSSELIFVLSSVSLFTALILVTAGYSLYRDALRGRESPAWLIALPIVWTYPLPVMAYTVAVYHQRFLRVLSGETIFRSYHFPGAMERLMILVFAGLIVATIYSAVNIYVHIKLYRARSKQVVEVAPRTLLRMAESFFLKIHYIALVYAFLVVPLAISSIGIFAMYLIILPALYIPLGPISIAVQSLYLCGPLITELSPSYSLPLAISVALLLKVSIYMLLRRSRVASYSAPIVLAIATTTACILVALSWMRITALVAGLVATLSMDLTALSYIKYRDAANGRAPRIWIPVLATLWSLAVWIPAIAYPSKWLNWIEYLHNLTPPAIAIWIAITLLQVAFSIAYHHRARELPKPTTTV